MTLTATRDDATLTTGAVAAFFGKKKTPEELLTDALSAFTTAEKKLTEAMDEISQQETELRQKQAEIQGKLSNAEAAKGRLQRVKERIGNLLA